MQWAIKGGDAVLVVLEVRGQLAIEGGYAVLVVLEVRCAVGLLHQAVEGGGASRGVGFGGMYR